MVTIPEIDDGWCDTSWQDSENDEERTLEADKKNLLKLALNGPFEEFKSYLLEHPSLLDIVDEEGDGLVNEAARGRQLENLQFLIEDKKAPIIQKNNSGHTAFYWALKKNNFLCLKYLLEKQGDLPPSETGLGFAGKLKAIRSNDDMDDKQKDDLLLQLGSCLPCSLELSEALQLEVNRALMFVATRNLVEHTNLFIKLGGDIEYKDSHKDTVLNEAARMGAPDAVELLLQQGAQVNVPNKDGKTALAWCLVAEKEVDKKYAVAKKLIFAGADLSRKCRLGDGKSLKTLYQHILDNKAMVAILDEADYAGWLKDGDHRINKMSFINGGQHLLTEIFNFKAQERFTIMKNLSDDNESLCRDGFQNVANKNDIWQAAEELKKRGGAIDLKTVGRYKPTTQITFKPKKR